MKIKQIMSTNLIISEEENNTQKIAQIMLEYDIGFIPIANDNNEIIGVITDRDIVINIISNNDLNNPTNYMSTNLISINQNETLEDALKLMKKEEIKRLLVTDEEEMLVGIVSLSDFLNTNIDQELLINTMKSIWKINKNEDKIISKVNEFKL